MSCAAMIAPSDNTLSALLDQACNSADPYQSAALHPWLSASARTACEKNIFAQRRHPRIFAQATYTPVSLLQRLALENDSVILDKLVKNFATPTPVLQQLAQDKHGKHRLNLIAAHANASTALLDSLDEQASPERRQAICSNPNAGLIQLNRLLVNASLGECKKMAQNPHVDAVFLARLWQAHDEVYLHAEIASHRNCPLGFLNIALNSDVVLLRRKAAANPKLSDAQLLQSLSDSESQVRVAALRQLVAVNVAQADEPARRVRRELARKTGLNEELLNKLSLDEDSWVRRWLARNPATPESVLKKLATDAEVEVRRGVARNPLTPTELCRQLATDPEYWVRAGIAIRADLDQSTIQQLSADDSVDVLAGLGRNLKTPEKLLRQIAGHGNRDVRRAVIINLQAPLEVLKEFLQDPYAFNRALLCRHPALTGQELWELTTDPESQVRFSAVQVLASRCGTDQ
jgi:hypothetical protein